jgi:hypothetical protein
MPLRPLPGALAMLVCRQRCMCLSPTGALCQLFCCHCRKATGARSKMTHKATSEHGIQLACVIVSCLRSGHLRGQIDTIHHMQPCRAQGRTIPTFLPVPRNLRSQTDCKLQPRTKAAVKQSFCSVSRCHWSRASYQSKPSMLHIKLEPSKPSDL